MSLQTEEFCNVGWIQEHWKDIEPYATSVIGALAVLFVGWILAGWVGRLTSKACKKAKIEETLARFFGKLAKWAILLFVALGCLGMFGVDITAFAAFIAAAGFAIGLAFQGNAFQLRRRRHAAHLPAVQGRRCRLRFRRDRHSV